MRDGKWKIVKLKSGQDWELYNLEEDPSETIDLSSEHPDLLRRLDSSYFEWYGKYYDN